MASSAYQIISNVVEEIVKTQPKTILDIGIGFGKWGFLSREYLDCWRDKIYPNTWQIKIIGIEIWRPFADQLPWNRLFYDDIYIGDAYEIIDKIDENFDLIIANDVLEHLEKDRGLILLDKILNKTDKKAIVNVPIGEGWLGNVILDNNPYEAHKAVWSSNDLIKAANKHNCEYRSISWRGVRGVGVLGIFEKGVE